MGINWSSKVSSAEEEDNDETESAPFKLKAPCPPPVTTESVPVNGQQVKRGSEMPEEERGSYETEPVPTEKRELNPTPSKAEKRAHFDPQNIKETTFTDLMKIDDPPTPYPEKDPTADQKPGQTAVIANLSDKLNFLAMAQENSAESGNFIEDSRKTSFQAKKMAHYTDEGAALRKKSDQKD